MCKHSCIYILIFIPTCRSKCCTGRYRYNSMEDNLITKYSFKINDFYTSYIINNESYMHTVIEK